MCASRDILLYIIYFIPIPFARIWVSRCRSRATDFEIVSGALPDAAHAADSLLSYSHVSI